MHRRIRTLATAAAIVAFRLSLSGCRQAAGADADDPPPARLDGQLLVLPANSPQIATLRATPAVADSATTVAMNGRLVWNEDETVRVFSPFGGRVDGILADVGQHVRPRDPLAMIASPDFGQAQADARRAAADLDLAERTLARQTRLLDQGIIARKEVESAEADVVRARAERQRAQSRIASYGGDTAVTQLFPLRTPLGGVVVERNITPGQEVRSDQMLANAPQLFAPLFVVTDPSRLWLLLDVPEPELPFVRPGTPVVVRARTWPTGAYRGRITLVGAGVDPSTRTVKARGVIDNPDGALRAEIFVSVELHRAPSAVVAVPTDAVLLDGDSHVVFVEEAPGKYRRCKVRIGDEHDGVVPVLDGVVAGQRVVTGSALLLEQLYRTTAAGS